LERSLREYEKNIWDQSLTYGHYNLHDTSLLNNLINDKSSFVEYCKDHQILVLAAAPLSMGLLTQRGPPDWHPASSDLKEACRHASNICQQYSIDISTLALLFALSNPQIPTTVVGMSTIEEVKAVHLIALRFVEFDDDKLSTLSQEEILNRILSLEERRALDIIQDPINGPFATIRKNGLYQWDGIEIANNFCKSLNPNQPVNSWQQSI
jgi:predicted aldo/keto reductase-like oxidoreductase